MTMGAAIENFKGIEFVRISSMPKDQQEKVWQSFEKEKIIKIIKDQSLMNDCILVSDFSAWQSKQLAIQQHPVARTSHPTVSRLGKLAFE